MQQALDCGQQEGVSSTMTWRKGKQNWEEHQSACIP